MPRPQPPAGFITISPGIYLSLAPLDRPAAAQPDDRAPNVILIFGWMGGLTRHLQRYSQKYAEIYPHATQIMIRCESTLFYSSAKTRKKRLMPVVQVLETFGCLSAADKNTQASTRARPRVLVHSFSNGGGLQLTSLARLLASKYPSVSTSEHLMSALIMDSAPSAGSFHTIGMAFRIAIRNPVARYVVLVVVYFLRVLELALYMLFGRETVAMRYHKALLQPRLLPWMTSQTPRLYVFSRKDALVPWREVQQHVDAAKASGFHVRCEVYEESAHVNHMCHDPKRYWTSIRELWRVACRENEEQGVEAD